MITLQNWMFLVSGLSFLGSFLGFFTDELQSKQFSRAPMQVSPLCRRIYGAWTLVASIVRLQYARHMHERGLYEATFATFIVAFLIYGHETFISKTVPLKKAMAPFIVAGLSMYLMWHNPS